MRTANRALGLAVLCALAPGVGVATSTPSALELELKVALEQHDREFGGEGYSAAYRHLATTTLRGRLTPKSEILDGEWDGYETCQEPPLELKWKSPIDFEAFEYAEPEVGIVIRGAEAWLLYHPSREFGIEHPGRPDCDAADGIAPGTWVARSFFFEDLAEGAQDALDAPIYFEDDRDSWGGFVVAVLPLNELRAGVPIPVSVTYESDSEVFTIRMRIEGVVAPIP